MVIPQTQNPPQPAPQVDLSDSLVPKSPVAEQTSGQNIDLSDSLVPNDSTQSQTTQSHPGIFDLLSGNPQASSEVGEGFIKRGKETVRNIIGATASEGK